MASEGGGANQEARRRPIFLLLSALNFEHLSVIESQQEDVAEIIARHTGNAVSGENIQQLAHR